MQHYRQKWGTQRFVLVGYSFGADVLPATYNRLPEAEQKRVDSIMLLALPAAAVLRSMSMAGWARLAQKRIPAKKCPSCQPVKWCASMAQKKSMKALTHCKTAAAKASSCPAAITSTKITRPWPSAWWT